MEKIVKIIVATHKNYKMPDDKMYVPLQVGAKSKKSFGFKRDDTGDNISIKNPYFCELTGLYWAYKNLSADYIGLVHYRRYFKGKNKGQDKFQRILTLKEVIKIVDEVDIILPKKRNYYIETLYNHYKHTMFVEPLDIVGKIIEEKHYKYYKEFENLKKRRKAHMFNMLIMKKNRFDEYCSWLFEILFELEKRVNNSTYNSFHARFYGRISELLLDVWINTNQYSYKELPIINMEKVNWYAKCKSFLNAKFLNRKYEKSF